MREILVTSVSALLTTPLVLASLIIAEAQVMGSSNYRIESDSINVGGGLTTSTNYSLESTGGEIGTGELESDSYRLGAGYQQMQGSYIAISEFGAVTMSPSIPGISGGFANGSTTVRVTTDSASGYILQIAASTNPAMQKGSDTIEDYVPAGAAPDFSFTTAAADAHFGYSPEGVDIVNRFKDNGAACNVGALDTALACWDGLDTEAVTVADGGANQPDGATTTLNFRVGVGGSVVQASGYYTATTTLTALTI